MSTKLMRAGRIACDLPMAASFSSRASGTDTSPTLGSMVQNGKLAACAAAVRVNALKSVDLPTFGRPTMPILKPMGISGKTLGFNWVGLAEMSIFAAALPSKPGSHQPMRACIPCLRPHSVAKVS
ncbi:hypothetical protein D3C87_1853610 [compost metagenome]